MNRRLRKRHQLMLTGLALLLPIGFGLALQARPEIPAGGGRIAALGPAVPQDGTTATQISWGELGIRSRYWAASQERAAVVQLTAAEDLALPDVLLYWSENKEDALQGDEFLLGSFFGEQTQRYSLPAGATSTGRLFLYSLAHDEVVGTADLSETGD